MPLRVRACPGVKGMNPLGRTRALQGAERALECAGVPWRALVCSGVCKCALEGAGVPQRVFQHTQGPGQTSLGCWMPHRAMERGP